MAKTLAVLRYHHLYGNSFGCAAIVQRYKDQKAIGFHDPVTALSSFKNIF